MRMRRPYRRLSLVLIFSTTALLLMFSDHGLYFSSRSNAEFEEDDLKNIDINKNDVMVVLHIPRTGMTSLSNHLINDVELDKPCKCESRMTKCKCLNKNGHYWLFNSYNTTGFVCGEHADFTTLTNCPIDYWFRTSGKDTRQLRRYFIITMLREPVSRYVSEYLFTKNEDTFFKNEPRLFRFTSLELQKKKLACFVGKKLSNLTLEQFINCEDNPARNRQTRMLANLKEVNSLGLKGDAYDEALLASAKTTLETLPFFGLLHRPKDTQLLFEAEFGIHFKDTFKNKTTASQALLPIPAQLKHRLLQEINLDIRLLTFANELFQGRISELKEKNSIQRGSNGDESVDGFKIVYRPDLKESDRDKDKEGLGTEPREEQVNVDEVYVEEENEKDEEDAMGAVSDNEEEDGDHGDSDKDEDHDESDKDHDEDANARSEQIVRKSSTEQNIGQLPSGIQYNVEGAGPYLKEHNVEKVDTKSEQMTGQSPIESNIGQVQTDTQYEVGVAGQNVEKRSAENFGKVDGRTTWDDRSEVASNDIVTERDRKYLGFHKDNDGVVHKGTSPPYPDDTEDVSTFLDRLEQAKQGQSNGIMMKPSYSQQQQQYKTFLPQQQGIKQQMPGSSQHQQLVPKQQLVLQNQELQNKFDQPNQMSPNIQKDSNLNQQNVLRFGSPAVKIPRTNEEKMIDRMFL